MLRSIYDLADVFQTKRIFTEAEPLPLDAAEYVQKNAGGGTLHRDVFQRLARFYETCGKNAEAAEVRKKLAQLN